MSSLYCPLPSRKLFRKRTVEKSSQSCGACVGGWGGVIQLPLPALAFSPLPPVRKVIGFKGLGKSALSSYFSICGFLATPNSRRDLSLVTAAKRSGTNLRAITLKSLPWRTGSFSSKLENSHIVPISPEGTWNFTSGNTNNS